MEDGSSDAEDVADSDEQLDADALTVQDDGWLARLDREIVPSAATG